HAPQLEVLQQLFEFFSHGYLYRARNNRAPRGAESSAPAGRDHRGHTGRLRALRRGRARADIREVVAAVAAETRPPPYGLFASVPPHSRQSQVPRVGWLVPPGAARSAS